VDLKEELEQVTVGQLVGVEHDLYGFRMGSVVAVGGVGCVATGVADPRREHAGQLADEVLHPPEAASGQDRGRRLVGHADAPSVCGVFRTSESAAGFVLAHDPRATA
jgi:hypothetical protein